MEFIGIDKYHKMEGGQKNVYQHQIMEASNHCVRLETMSGLARMYFY